MKEHFPKLWSMLTRTRPMWGMIPLRVMFGVVLLLQGAERFVSVRQEGTLLHSLSLEWQIAIVVAFSVSEILCGVLVIPGVFVRLVGLVTVVEVVVSIVVERVPLRFNGDLQAQMLIFAIAALMLFSGAGRFSVDHWLACRHLARYPSKKWELYCLAETPYTKWWE